MKLMLAVTIAVLFSACCSWPTKHPKPIEPDGTEIVPVETSKRQQTPHLQFAIPGKNWVADYNVRVMFDGLPPAKMIMTHQGTGAIILLYRFEDADADPVHLVEATKRGMIKGGASVFARHMRDVRDQSYTWISRNGDQCKYGKVSGMIVNENPKMVAVLVGEWLCNVDRGISLDFDNFEDSLNVVFSSY